MIFNLVRMHHIKVPNGLAQFYSLSNVGLAHSLTARGTRNPLLYERDRLSWFYCCTIVRRMLNGVPIQEAITVVEEACGVLLMLELLSF